MAKPFWSMVSCWSRMRLSWAACSVFGIGPGEGPAWVPTGDLSAEAEAEAEAGRMVLRGSEAAIDSVSARALDEVYWASSSASRLESLRISLGFCENQRSTARFIRP